MNRFEKKFSKDLVGKSIKFIFPNKYKNYKKEYFVGYFIGYNKLYNGMIYNLPLIIGNFKSSLDKPIYFLVTSKEIDFIDNVSLTKIPKVHSDNLRAISLNNKVTVNKNSKIAIIMREVIDIEHFYLSFLYGLSQEGFAEIPIQFIGKDNLTYLKSSIGKLKNYFFSMEKDGYRRYYVFKVDFEKNNAKRYLRFGIVPKNNKSRNFIKHRYEVGVSVFDLKENKPVLSNFRLLESFSSRKDVLQFLVTGDVVGKGQDGEPLLENVKYICPISFNVEEITKSTLNENFKGQKELYGNYKYDYCYLNFTNGIRVLYLDKEYSNPINTFDMSYGLN